MPEITAAMVKALREETQQGMMECKKALTETGGDIEAAKDLLRKKGLATAEKKAARTTSEGLIGLKRNADGSAAAMVEVRCETDFAARNERFKELVEKLTDMALASAPGELPASDEVNAVVQDVLAKIGENMSYARGVKIAAEKVGTYLHHNNKVGVIVGVEGPAEEQLLTDLCMHIAFADPVAITPDEVPAEMVEKERQFAIQEAKDSGKPQEIAEKMVEGKMRKYLASLALLEQPFVRDEKQKVKDVLGEAKIVRFARYAVGG